jgi:hypothetical protein
MSEGEPTAARVRPKFASRFLHSQEIGIIGALVIMVAALCVFDPGFTGVDNIVNDAVSLSTRAASAFPGLDGPGQISFIPLSDACPSRPTMM